MSRYYSIEIGGTTPQATPVPGGSTTPSLSATFTNMYGGKWDPGAPMIDLDIQASSMDQAFGLAATVTIWGVSLKQIAQASNFNGSSIIIRAGMQNGLPLATAAVNNNQQGIILTGQVFSAFGNYIGVNQSLILQCSVTGLLTQANPGNIVFNWTKGQQMGIAIYNTLHAAYPNAVIQGYQSISQKLVQGQDEPSTYDTINQFSTYITNKSQAIIGGSYSGVSIYPNGLGFQVFDNSNTTAPVTAIKFQDMIGQITWLGINQVSFSTVLRADLTVGSNVSFPPVASFQTTTTTNSYAAFRNSATFSGTWIIQYVRHVGNNRAPDATGWISTYQAYAVGADQLVTSTGNTSA